MATNETKYNRSIAMMASAGSAVKLVSVEYEVFGKVQGVFFRKFTQQNAQKLGLVGWVKNTNQGTVTGVVQGPEGKVTEMKNWLQLTGSPKSQIEKCDFKNERSLSKYDFQAFIIDKPKKKKKVRP